MPTENGPSVAAWVLGTPGHYLLGSDSPIMMNWRERAACLYEGTMTGRVWSQARCP